MFARSIVWLLILSPAAVWGAEPGREVPKVPARVDRYGDPLPPGALVRFGSVRWRLPPDTEGLLFLPDGKTLVSAGHEGIPVCWDTRIGAEVRPLDLTGAAPKRRAQILSGMHTEIMVGRLAVAPARHLLACGYHDRIHLWDLRTGKITRTLDAGTEGLLVLALSADGRRLAAGYLDGRLRTWDLVRGRQGHNWVGHRHPVRALAFSPDGQTLASGEARHYGRDDPDYRYEIGVWDARTGRLRRRLVGDNGRITGLAFFPDGRTLVSVGPSTPPHLWDVESGRTQDRLEATTEKSWSHCVSLSADGKYLAMGAYGLLYNRAEVWEVASGRKVRTIHIPSRHAIRQVALSLDGKQLALAANPFLLLHDVATGTVLGRTPGHTDDVLCSALSMDGRLLATGGMDRTARLWDTATGKELRVLRGHSSEILRVAWSPDGHTLATAGNKDRSKDPATDCDVRLWEVRTGRLLQVFPGRERSFRIWSLTFTPDGQMVAAADNAGTRFWEVSTGQPRNCLQDEEAHRALVFSPDGRTLAGHAWPNRVRPFRALLLWDWPSGRLRKTIAGHDQVVTDLAFSPDGKEVALAGSDRLYRLDMASGRYVPTLLSPRERYWHRERPGTSQVAYSPDGSLLVSSYERGGMVRVWEAATGQLALVIDAQDGSGRGLSFLPDGRRLVSVGKDRVGYVWDILSPYRRAPATWTRNGEVPLDLGPEGLWEALGSTQASVAFWVVCKLSASPSQAMELLQARLRPSEPPDQSHIRRLVAKLDSPRFTTREAASRELETLGAVAASELRRATETGGSPELRRRAQALLDRLVEERWAPQRLRQRRSVQVLEYLNTTASRALLDRLSQGDPSAPLTAEARAALARMNRHRK